MNQSGVLDHPARIDAHVVGDHVAGHADAAPRRPVLQVLQRLLAAKIGGDVVIEKRIGRRHRVRIAAQLLDLLRGPAAFPETDQPQSGHAPARQHVQLLIRDLIEPADVALVFLGQLIEPNVDVLGHQDQLGHPVAILAEALGLDVLADVLVDQGPARTAAGRALLLLLHEVLAEQKPIKVLAEQVSPFFENIRQLAAQRMGRSDARGCATFRRGSAPPARTPAGSQRTRRARRRSPGRPCHAVAARRRKARRTDRRPG